MHMLKHKANKTITTVSTFMATKCQQCQQLTEKLSPPPLSPSGSSVIVLTLVRSVLSVGDGEVERHRSDALVPKRAHKQLHAHQGKYTDEECG